MFQARIQQGTARVRAAFLPVLQAAVAASVAVGISRALFGHPQPFFAAIAAWLCLGFSFDRRLRTIAEVALGVTFGVAVGDLVVHAIGSGWWQLSTVLVVSALLARFIDRGAVLTAQAGAQSIVIVGMPFLTGGPFGRAADALIGGGVALAFAMLTPGNPRRRLRTLGVAGTTALAEVISRTAEACRTGSEAGIHTTLVQARSAQPTLDEWIDLSRLAAESARLNINRLHLDDLDWFNDQAVLVERAMRTIRVALRRATPGVTQADEEQRALVADLLDRLAAGTGELAADLASGQRTETPSQTLLALAADASPHHPGLDLGVQALVLLLRSAIIDLLAATGTPESVAHAAFAEP